MNKQKAKNMLGLAMRAGKIISGEELVLRDIRQQKVPLVFVASDASQNTQKKIKDKGKFYHATVLDSFTADEIIQSIGKPRMVVGVVDHGFARRIKELLSEEL
ncbi:MULTISPECIES: YlxQ-related RNA-binding protein [Enterococcus]|uniref:50S ribosomal protein L7A n=1 Tax=Enterococcus sulfureus ATCC 49903 TaxID=1140003 RepID=S0KQ82_9ENTE|nr:YlxQ-related RNA-binding protein [Enterococcus sulfureus]EOT46949.1 50S ribosomal protein L7A [Enterococcus sulfureus ATCC 49903]EOT83756.1 50S ribosomal protein L7A [Enterococcus sulfureus ATCC 49903]